MQVVYLYFLISFFNGTNERKFCAQNYKYVVEKVERNYSSLYLLETSFIA